MLVSVLGWEVASWAIQSFKLHSKSGKLPVVTQSRKTHHRIRMFCDESHRGRNVNSGFEEGQVDWWGQDTSASFLCSPEAGHEGLMQSVLKDRGRVLPVPPSDCAVCKQGLSFNSPSVSLLPSPALCTPGIFVEQMIEERDEAEKSNLRQEQSFQLTEWLCQKVTYFPVVLI